MEGMRNQERIKQTLTLILCYRFSKSNSMSELRIFARGACAPFKSRYCTIRHLMWKKESFHIVPEAKFINTYTDIESKFARKLK